MELVGTENRLVIARGGNEGWGKWGNVVKGTKFQL